MRYEINLDDVTSMQQSIQDACFKAGKEEVQFVEMAAKTLFILKLWADLERGHEESDKYTYEGIIHVAQAMRDGQITVKINIDK